MYGGMCGGRGRTLVSQGPSKMNRGESRESMVTSSEELMTISYSGTGSGCGSFMSYLQRGLRGTAFEQPTHRPLPGWHNTAPWQGKNTRSAGVIRGLPPADPQN